MNISQPFSNDDARGRVLVAFSVNKVEVRRAGSVEWDGDGWGFVGWDVQGATRDRVLSIAQQALSFSIAQRAA